MSKVSLVNKSITDKITKSTVILDPAGLSYMQSSFSGAGGASGAIYKLLDTNKPNYEVINHFKKFKDLDDLYKNNKNNLSVAHYGSYNDNNIKLIHTVGPDFRTSKYLQEILNNTQETDKLFYKIYDDVYKEFIRVSNENKGKAKLTLRLLPISSGIFINNDFISKFKVFRSLIITYHKLNDKYKKELKTKPKIYLYDKDDHKLMKFLSQIKLN